MNQSFPTCLAFTLHEEGGWENNPRDPGGATMRGITFREFLRWRPHATVRDLRNISSTDVAAIYHADYWLAVHADALPAGLDLMAFDFGVNAGPGQATRELQASVGVDQDGIIGPISLAALAKVSVTETIAKMAGAQKAHYRLLDDFPEFGEGWLARTDRRVAAALKLAAVKAAAVTG